MATIKYLDDEDFNGSIEISPGAGGAQPKYLDREELDRQNSLQANPAAATPKIKYIDEPAQQNRPQQEVPAPDSMKYEDMMKAEADKKAQEAQAVIQQQQAEAQRQEADLNPESWSSERFRKESPPPRTMEEQAIFNATIARKKAKEQELTNQLLPEELRPKPAIDIKKPEEKASIKYVDEEPPKTPEEGQRPGEKKYTSILDPIIRGAGAVVGIPSSFPIPTPEKVSESAGPIVNAHPMLKELAKSYDDIAAIPLEFFNQLAMNYPKSGLHQAGYDLPQAGSAPGKALQLAAGIAGAVKNPLFKVLGVGPKASVGALSRAGGIYGALMAPNDDLLGLGERAVQGSLGAVVPFGAHGASKAIQGVSPALKAGAARLVNSFVKPLLKHMSYGKNPGMGVAQAGITANSIEELERKISIKLRAIGVEIGGVLKSRSSERINLERIIAPLARARQKAMRSPRTNQAVIKRLDDLIMDIKGIELDEAGNIISQKDFSALSPGEAFKIKELIGTLTKFTGNPSDDEMVNKALKMAYGIAKSGINAVAPELKKLNELYANLLSAKVATVYRDKIASRQNLIGLAPRVAWYSGVIGAIMSGQINAMVGTIAAIGIDKIVSSPAFKTRLAAGMFKLSEGNLAKLLTQFPKLEQFAWKLYRGLNGIGKEDTKFAQKAMKLLEGPADRAAIEGPGVAQKALGVTSKHGEGFVINTPEQAYAKLVEFANKYWSATKKRLIIPEHEATPRTVNMLKRFGIDPFTGKIKDPQLKTSLEIAMAANRRSVGAAGLNEIRENYAVLAPVDLAEGVPAASSEYRGVQNIMTRGRMPSENIPGEVKYLRDISSDVKTISEEIPQSRGAGKIPYPVKSKPIEMSEKASDIDWIQTQDPDKFSTQKGSPIVMNQDYGPTFTPDPSCAKGKVLRNQTITMRKVLDDAGLTAEEKTAASRKLFEAGLRQKMEAPCVVCYEYEKQLTGYNAKPMTYGSKVYEPGAIIPHLPEIAKRGYVLRGYGVGDFKAADINSLLALGRDLEAHPGFGYGQYTKNLNLLEIAGDVGFKYNISTGTNKRIGIPLKTAIPYRDRYPNAGIEYTAINEADLHFAGEHPKVDLIIPAHLGGGTPETFLKNATGMEIKNFQKDQTEKVLGKVLHSPELIAKFGAEKMEYVRKLVRESKYKKNVDEYLAAIDKASSILKQEVTPIFKQYRYSPWYKKLLGTGPSEYGKHPGVPKINMSKFNFDKAIEYMKQPDIDYSSLTKRYGQIANKIVNAAKRGGVEAIKKMNARYLSLLAGSGAAAATAAVDEG